MTSIRVADLARALALVGGLGAAACAFGVGEPNAPPASSGGTDRVCINREATTLQDTFGGCRRGDIIVVAGLKTSGITMVCDFGKTILYSRGEPVACVYVGYIRAEVKQ